MAYDAHANFAYSTVLTAPSPATSGTSVVLQSGDGANFPTPPFNVTIWPANATPTKANAEIARCTAKSTDTLTITRAQEGTSARTVVVGDQIAVAVTAKLLSDIETAADAAQSTATSASSAASTAQSTASAAAVKANNLSDLASASTARSNLGLGTAATHPVGDFAQVANNLSDIASASSARSNLGLGSIATHPATDYYAVTVTLDGIAAPAADVSLNSHKITGLANGSAASDAAAFGQIPVVGGVGGLIKTVVRTADSSTITAQATPQNDDTLLFNVGANDRWIILGFLTFIQANSTGAATTADLKIGFSLPASGSIRGGSLGVNTNASGMAGYGYSTTASAPNALSTTTISLGGTAATYGVSIMYFYTGGGTSGTVTLQWSQNTSDASTLAIGKDSALVLIRVA